MLVVLPLLGLELDLGDPGVVPVRATGAIQNPERFGQMTFCHDSGKRRFIPRGGLEAAPEERLLAHSTDGGEVLEGARPGLGGGRVAALPGLARGAAAVVLGAAGRAEIGISLGWMEGEGGERRGREKMGLGAGSGAFGGPG